MRFRLSLLPFAIVLVLGFAACSSDGDPEPSPTATAAPVSSYAEPGPYGVGVMTVELVDTSRPTPANGAFTGSPERLLPLEIWYPAASSAQSPEERDIAIDESGGPYPLIVFAHGLTGTRVQSPLFTRHLASRGYVVVSPDFPSSFAGAPGGPRLRAVLEQPGDVSFVIDELVARDREADWALAGDIDFERIGMTGHSLGGLTTLLTVYGAGRDDRIDAALPFSPPTCFVGAGVVGDTTLPIMVAGGSEELIVDPSWIRRAYDIARAPRYYVELGGADHVKFADVDINDRDLGEGIVGRIAGEETVIQDAIEISQATQGNAGECLTRDGPRGAEYITGDRQRQLMRLFGGLFFDAYLRGDETALGVIRGGDLSAAAPEAVVEFE